MEADARVSTTSDERYQQHREQATAAKRATRTGWRVCGQRNHERKVELLWNGQIRRPNGQVVTLETLARLAQESPRAHRDLLDAHALIRRAREEARAKERQEKAEASDGS